MDRTTDRALVRPDTMPQCCKPRIAVLDALRGFAILGMLLTHMSEQFIAGSPQVHWSNLGIESPLDRVAQIGVDALMRGKAFALFSVLFGASFFLQMKSADDVHDCPGCWFLRRMAFLCAIGLVHHLFWPGDVLTLYAAGGVLLLLVRHWSDSALIGAACFLLFGGARLATFIVQQAFGCDIQIPQVSAVRQDAYIHSLMGSSISQVFVENYLHGFRLVGSFLFGVHGRAYQTLGLFILGLYLARSGWHVRVLTKPRQLYRTVYAGTALLGMAAFGLAACQKASFCDAAVRRTLVDILNLGAAAVVVSAFCLMYLRYANAFTVHVLACVGRAGLTAYVTQTIIGTFLMYGWGLGMLGIATVTQAVCLGVLIFLIQGAAFTWWFRVFRYGPLEWAWRIGSYGRWEPIRVA